uniref:Uncharacterized protein n=1 Tax=Lepeophtheirus salmonis TaxID=72036 RepID=A0A0K2UEC1_LEPSM
MENVAFRGQYHNSSTC